MSPAADTPRLVDGPAAAAATLLLAHGAGTPMDSPFLATIAAGLAQRGWRVVRFEFPFMARQRRGERRAPPDRMPALQACFRAQVERELGRGGGALLIGGHSLGGRVASLLADELAEALAVRACLCLGFPFHHPRTPERWRSRHLATQRTPTLILQGERDPFGRPEAVRGCPLSPAVRLAWLPAGDHSLRPSRSSGLSEGDNWRSAGEQADRFLRGLAAP